MRIIDMIHICRRCEYRKTIYYADGSNSIGCLAYDVKCPYPVDIRNIKHCPLGKDEKE